MCPVAGQSGQTDSQESCPSFISDSSKDASPQQLPSAVSRVPREQSTSVSGFSPSQPLFSPSLTGLSKQDDELEPTGQRTGRAGAVEAGDAVWTQAIAHPVGCASCAEPLVGEGLPMPGCGHLVLCPPCSRVLPQLGLGPSDMADWCRFCSTIGRQGSNAHVGVAVLGPHAP